jgi:LPS-assembly lipoprotein
MCPASCSTSSSAERRSAVRVALIATVVVLLGACGFHLRGSVEGAQGWGPVHVVALRDVAVEEALLRTLRQSGGEVVDARTDADLVVELIEQDESRRTLSYTERARTAEYEITARLRYRVVDRDGREWLTERRIESVRTFRIDRDNLAASSQEEDLLREEQGADLAQQVARSLDAAARNRRAGSDGAGPA